MNSLNKVNRGKKSGPIISKEEKLKEGRPTHLLEIDANEMPPR